MPPKVAFSNFGRGSSVDNTVIQGLYDTIKTLLDTTKLGASNLANDSGIAESRILWSNNPLTEHTHSDKSLGEGVVGSRQLDTFTTTNRVPCICTQSPGVMAIAGTTGLVDLGSSPVFRRVEFGEGASPKGSFPAGTIPQVYITPYFDGSPIPGTHSIKSSIQDIDSMGFTVRLDVSPVLSGYSFYINYFAIGQAPGRLTWPYPWGVVYFE